jgi:hypothetical protein
MDKRQMFFSGRNKSIIYNNIAQATGVQLSENQSKKLDKMIGHYMREVWTAKNGQPIPLLNSEVTNATKQQFINSPAVGRAPASSTQASVQQQQQQQQPRLQPKQMGTLIEDLNLGSTSRPIQGPAMFQDTTKTLEELHKERQGIQPERPPIPDFRITSEEEDGPSPLELYEMAKKSREAEEASRPPTTTNSIELPNSSYGSVPTSGDVFRQILGPDVSSANMQPLPPPIKTKKRVEFEPPMLPPRVPLPLPMTIDAPIQPSAKQLTLLRQDNIQQYKEFEQNLFINSIDRDWTKDSLFDWNRYNFTINFDPSAVSQTYNLTPFSQKKFKDIVRIQLIKVIVPRETLSTLVTRTAVNTPATTSQFNVLAYPSVVVRIPELNGNNYGTNDSINNAFGLIHYDAQWTSDPIGAAAVVSTGITTSNGYVSLIPKFLNCQRVYEPTPLATLSKLTLRLEQPFNANLLSSTSDVLAVSGFSLGSDVGTSIYRTVAPSSYIFIETSTYFSKFLWESGDLLFFKNVAAITTGATDTTVASINALSEFINRPEGHNIIAIGVKSGAWSAGVSDGGNAVGYANVIIIENKLAADATTGSTTAYSWGNEGNITTALADAATTFAGNTINASHQVQAVFRIVTREYDPAAKLRPDNLN